jgi:hypothetical protein
MHRQSCGNWGNYLDGYGRCTDRLPSCGCAGVVIWWLGLQLDPMTRPVRNCEFLKTACRSHRVRTAVAYVYLKIEIKDIEETT